MAINIKEILHPSDSDSIKFEKINYNFDQILINGGGPQGIQGIKGQQGAEGATGVKGEKGEIGTKGDQGDPGVSDTPWERVTNVSNNSHILKPKLDGDASASALWLGDSTFNEGGSGQDLTGETTANARITLELDPGEYDHFKSFRIAPDKVLNFTHDIINSVDTFGFKKDFGSATSELAFQIAVNSINLSAENDIQLSSQGLTIDIDPGNGVIKFHDTVNSLNVHNVEFDLETLFYAKSVWTNTSSIRLPAGTTAERTLDTNQGQIRFNTDTDQFEGRHGSDWRGLGGLIDADQDTYITAEEAPDEDVLRMYAGGTELISVNVSIGDNFSITDNAISIKNTTELLGDLQINESGRGILYKADEGGSLGAGELDAPNEGTTKSQRRIDDYFYQPSTTSDFGDLALDGNTDSAFASNSWVRFLDATWLTSTNQFRVHKKVSNQNQTLVNAQALRMAIRPSKSKITYTKIGHQVTASGQINYMPAPLNTIHYSNGMNLNGEYGADNTPASGSQMAQNIKGRVAVFPSPIYWPYRNAAAHWILFPIMIQIDGFKNTDGFEDNYTEEYWGAIPPGGNYFNIAKKKPTTIVINDGFGEENQSTVFG